MKIRFENVYIKTKEIIDMNDKMNMLWDEAPVDVTAEANFIWSIANKLRGSYRRVHLNDLKRVIG